MAHFRRHFWRRYQRYRKTEGAMTCYSSRAFIWYKFRFCALKTLGGVSRTKCRTKRLGRTDRQTDGQTDRQTENNIPFSRGIITQRLIRSNACGSCFIPRLHYLTAHARIATKIHPVFLFTAVCNIVTAAILNRQQFLWSKRRTSD